MIDLNGLTKQLGDYRRKNCLPQGNYEYSFLRAVGETIEAYEAHRRGDNINLGEELADAIIFILDVADQKDIDIEQALLKKFERIKRRHYVKHNGYIVKEES